jgi:hypothetical protein
MSTPAVARPVATKTFARRDEGENSDPLQRPHSTRDAAIRS